ncbi:hypothetical protein BJ165DRAFT_205716 [Panaeolus papilionaceus]|nr:hypothetical protein BJ165DRAFT_205716 [Panaeolus papilionaceus]
MAALSLMFSSSRLRYLSLTDTGSEGNRAFRRSLFFSTFLQQLVYNGVPELTSLKLACSPTEGTLNSLTAIEAPTDLDLDFVDGEGIIEWDVFESLAHYDLLTSLSISSESRFFSDSLIAMSPMTLQKLQNLKLFCDFDDAIEFLACFSTPSLTSFSLGFILPESPHTNTFPWNRLFHLLKKCSSDNIRQISITPRVSRLSEFEWEDSLEEFNNSYPGVPFQEFADALLQFDLNKLSLPFALLRSLDMDILKDIVDAWPQLRTLELYTASQQTLGTSALDVIAHRLPHLRHLALDINTSSIDTSA